MSAKTFTVAGFSVLNGTRKMRVANDLAGRVKILARNGHTEIELVQLDAPMTKEEIATMLGVSLKTKAAEVATEVATEVAAEVAIETAQLTFDEAMAQVPLRQKGRFIKKHIREQMARELIAA